MKTYEYKLQGDGRYSWVCTERDEVGNLLNEYMVYEDPNPPVQNPTPFLDFFANATPEEIEHIKKILGLI
jgi:hypothetical protein